LLGFLLSSYISSGKRNNNNNNNYAIVRKAQWEAI
jgi:hypothetical protein